jgi:8-oxo-dGTP diphosphatase
MADDGPPLMSTSRMPAAVHAVVAIIRRGDRFLVVKRADHLDAGAGHWSPVSGRIEEGETEEQALRREVREEVALDVVAERKVAVLPTADAAYVLHYWTARVQGGRASVASDESSALRWVTLAEMSRLQPRFEEDVEIVRALLREPRGPERGGA